MPLEGMDFDSLKKKAGKGLKAFQDGAKDFDAQATLKKAADGIASGADNVVKTVSESVSNFDAKDAMQKLGETVGAGASDIAQVVGDITHREQGTEDQHDSSREMIFLLSFLAAADGEVTQDEKKKISALAEEVDDSLGEACAAIIDTSAEQVDKDSVEFGYLAASKMNAQSVLDGLKLDAIERKTICWNLFAVASENGISKDEADYIRYVGDKLGLDAAVIEELSGYNDAIIELAAAIKQMKNTSKSFSEIEPLVNEMETREQTILQAAQALVTDR